METVKEYTVPCDQKQRGAVMDAVKHVPLTLPQGGGELTIAAMDEYSRLNIGRRTYVFARSVMRDPELRAKVKARAAEIKANGGIP